MNIDINDIGCKGRFQIKVKRSDGTDKFIFNWQDNLITNEGLKLMNGKKQIANDGSEIDNYDISSGCVVGSSTVTPTESDTKLGHLEASMLRSENFSEVLEDTTLTRSNYARHYWQKTYIFSDLDNKNITEVGLCGFKSSDNKDVYALYTHALITDRHGNPTSITVLKGEILQITYEFSTYYDVRPKLGEFKLKTIKGNKEVITTYQYRSSLVQISNTIATSGIYIKGSSSGLGLNTYGVDLEKDTDLTKPYDFSKWKTYTFNPTETDVTKQLNMFTDGVQNKQTSGEYTVTENWNYDQNVALKGETKVTDTTRETNFTFSPYANNHLNGIRAMTIPVCSVHHPHFQKAYLLVVVAEKGTSKGINKTENETLKLFFRTAVSRYKGKP